jgi:hypothetical protein
MLANQPQSWNRTIALAVIATCLVAACKEPNSAPAQGAAPSSAQAATASTPANAGLRPQELGADASKAELKPDTLCNLERIDNELLGSSVPFTPADLHHAVLTGWMGDESSKALPHDTALMIRQIGSGRVWQLPLDLTVQRADVATATGAAALKMSGFTLDVDFSALPPGSYRMVLVHDRDGGRYACDNGRDLKISG